MSAPAQVRASHLLVKHAGSRRPSSWKEERVTRSQDEALQMVKSFRWGGAGGPVAGGVGSSRVGQSLGVHQAGSAGARRQGMP